MTQFRLVICFYMFILPSVYCGLMGIEMWPFSNYPMYSKPARIKSNNWHIMYVIDKDNKATALSRSLFWPLEGHLLKEKIKSYEFFIDENEKIHKLLNFYAAKVRQDSVRSGLEIPEKLQLRSVSGKYSILNNSSHLQVDSFNIIAEVLVNP